MVRRITLSWQYYLAHTGNRNFSEPLCVIDPEGHRRIAENRRQLFMIAWRSYGRI